MESDRDKGAFLPQVVGDGCTDAAIAALAKRMGCPVYRAGDPVFINLFV